ncbi:MAG: chorismate lyase [Neisseriaceae bacterium]|nr:MAG: chorismate lyase [Neisseriaceae bacterium]
MEIGVLGNVGFLVEGWSDIAQREFFKFIQMPSLTRFLKSLPYDFSVQLTYLGQKALSAQDAISMEEASVYFVREVSLMLDAIEVVRARSSCLVSSVYWCQFLDCGVQPLGEKLFDIQTVSRSALRFGLISKEHNLIKTYEVIDNAIFRQSTLTVGYENLILTECFLPSIRQFL